MHDENTENIQPLHKANGIENLVKALNDYSETPFLEGGRL